jgi:MFS family permease
MRPPIFYGWWIVAAGFAIEGLIGALIFHAYGAYVVLLREEFGWSKTLLSAAFAMSRAESGILGPVQGWLTDRFGPRALIRAGMIIFGVGFMLFSQIGSPIAFFATFFLMALGSSLGGYLPVTVAIVNWFRRRRALALGISATGMAMGGLFVQVVVLALSRFGWRWTAFASGLLVLVVGVPIAQIVRHRPEPYGERPDGAPAMPAPPPPAGDVPRSPGATPIRDFTAQEAIRTRAFWFISIGHGAALLAVSAVMVHLIPCPARLGQRILDGDGVRPLARPRLGHARAPHGRAPRRLLRGHGVRDDQRVLVDDRHVRHDGRASHRGRPGRPHRLLPARLHAAGGVRRAGIRLLRAGAAPHPAAAAGLTPSTAASVRRRDRRCGRPR